MKSITHFMTELIDYAGLFPPAKLDLATAIHNYARYRDCDESWMLGRFIIPVSRLAELDAFAELFVSETKPFLFSALLKPCQDAEEFLGAFSESCQAITSFHIKYPGTAIIDVVETPFPNQAPNSFGEFFESLTSIADETLKRPVSMFFELKRDENWGENLKVAAQALAKDFKLRDMSTIWPNPGFKVRCGGVEEHMYPTTRQVAEALHEMGKLKVPVKATAGLHHPLRHFNDAAGVKMHGFLNVFLAGMLAHTHDISLEALEELVSEENPEAFKVDESSISWRSYRLSLDQIEEGRKRAMISFGSCSFDEPREDLKHLNLL